MSEQFEPHAELPPEPMLSEAETRRLVERLEARIKETEQLERARDTRPQPSAEPVAVWQEIKRQTYWRTNYNENPDEAAVAIIASALEAAHREALEQAAKVADDLGGVRPKTADQEPFRAQHTRAKTIAAAIRALKENPNAGDEQ